MIIFQEENLNLVCRHGYPNKKELHAAAHSMPSQFWVFGPRPESAGLENWHSPE